MAGDPVAAGEVWAAPSADQLDGFALLLLHASPEAQTERLRARGDDLSLIEHHIAFANWMREHVRNPQHMPFVITQNGWEEMRWERWADWHAGDPRWIFDEIDTTHLTREDVAQAVLAWIHRTLATHDASD